MMEKEKSTRKLKQCDKVKMTALAMIMKQAGYPYTRTASLFGIDNRRLTGWSTSLYRDESLQMYSKLINACRAEPSAQLITMPKAPKEVVVYLSGAITGIKELVVAKEFMDAERRIKSLGFSVVNPLSNGLTEEDSWEEHMRADIALMMSCNAIYIVNNIATSKGAKLELSIAKALGFKQLHYMWSDDKIRDVLNALRD